LIKGITVLEEVQYAMFVKVLKHVVQKSSTCGTRSVSVASRVSMIAASVFANDLRVVVVSASRKEAVDFFGFRAEHSGLLRADKVGYQLDGVCFDSSGHRVLVRGDPEGICGYAELSKVPALLISELEMARALADTLLDGSELLKL
jgi:hypothetical protein